MAHRLNHDSIANIFSQLKDRGGLNDHLTPLDALYRLKINLFYEKTCLTSKAINLLDKKRILRTHKTAGFKQSEQIDQEERRPTNNVIVGR